MTTPSDPTEEVRRQSRWRPSLLDVLIIAASAYLVWISATLALDVWHGLERELDVHEVME